MEGTTAGNLPLDEQLWAVCMYNMSQLISHPPTGLLSLPAQLPLRFHIAINKLIYSVQIDIHLSVFIFRRISFLEIYFSKRLIYFA